MITAMLVPALLYAFLSMSMNILSALIGNVIGSIPQGPNRDFSNDWRMNVPAFSWLMPTDPNVVETMVEAMQNSEENMGDVAFPIQTPPIQTFANPFLQNAMNPNNANMPGFNFGLFDQQVEEQVIFALFELILYGLFMKEMVRKIPGMAGDIAGGVKSLSVQATPIKQRFQEIKQGMKIGGGFALGASGAGAAAEAAGAGNAGRGAARTIGGVIGGLVGARAPI